MTRNNKFAEDIVFLFSLPTKMFLGLLRESFIEPRGVLYAQPKPSSELYNDVCKDEEEMSVNRLKLVTLDSERASPRSLPRNAY